MSDEPEPIKPDPDKKPKRPRDANQLAKLMVDLATGEADEADPDAGKDPKAVERGKAGGLKGGKARAEKLSKERRKEIAKKAAKTRWTKDSSS
ncbi:MAG: histone H1 [Planctomycetota bacterium]